MNHSGFSGSHGRDDSEVRQPLHAVVSTTQVFDAGGDFDVATAALAELDVDAEHLLYALRLNRRGGVYRPRHFKSAPMSLRIAQPLRFVRPAGEGIVVTSLWSMTLTLPAGVLMRSLV